MPASSLGRRRPRPVADAPLLDGAAVAKAWLVELVAVAPLEHAARLPGPRFAEDAPRLCAALSAALAGDAAFDELEPGGSLAPLAAGAGYLAAAPGPLDAVTALEALRAVIWAELQRGLDRPDAAQVAQLAERLAAVVATVTAAVLDASGPPGPPRPRDRGPLAAVLRGDAPPSDDAPAAAPEASGAAPGGEDLRDDPSSSPRAEEEGDAPPSPLRLAGETGDTGDVGAQDTPRRHVAPHLRDLESTLRDVAASEDPLARLRQLAEEAAPPRAPDPFTAAAARLRDSAGPLIEDGTEFHAARIAPWTAAIDRRLARHRQDGLPFAVLCVELVDVDRLAAADFDGEVARALEAAEGAVCATLRPADVLVRERPGRYWLAAPDTDGPEARTLAHRVAGAVTDAPAHRDAPLQAAIGVSVCPADGSDAATLEGRAEEGVYAARAAGVRVAGSPG